MIPLKSNYLEALEQMLAEGAAQLGPKFAQRNADYVRSLQRPDGGFAGRAGGSDVYYLDFVLRVLAMAGFRDECLVRAGAFLRGCTDAPKSVVECFGRLNSARLLQRAGIDVELDAGAVAPPPPGPDAGPYELFIAALCHQMLGTELPEASAGRAALRELRCADGGFCGSRAAASRSGQTNATAAVIAFLAAHEALPPEDGRAAAGFFASMQAPDGGFLAHRAAAESDLLSTFTALVALAHLEALGDVDLGAAGRFVRELAAAGGGFRASASDDESDVEYTYYGTAAAALLGWFVMRSGRRSITRP